MRTAATVAWRCARRQVAAYALMALAQAAGPVAMTWLTKAVLDGLSLGTGSLVGPAVALAVVGVATAAMPQVTEYLGRQISRAMTAHMTDRLFAATTAFVGLRRFEEPRFLDGLRLAQEGVTQAGTVVTGVFALARSALTLTGFTVSLLIISPAMTAIVLVSAVPALLAYLRLSRRRLAMLWAVSPVERRQFFYAELLSTIEAAKEIRLFGSGGLLRERMMTDLRGADLARRAVDRRELSTEVGLGLLASVVAGGGLVWAIGAATAGRLTPGDVSLFIAAVAAVQGALLALLGGIADAHHGLRLVGHYARVLREEQDLPIAGAAVPLPPLRDGIELRDVWFRYSDEHPWILRGVSLYLPRGQAVALVGSNGAGKSTLVKLLCRFYDPTRGSILWDGVDLREADPAGLRERITAVFQDYMCYDFSARDNIAIGEVTAMADLDRIRAAAGEAGLDRVLSDLPRGYDTQLTRMFVSEEERTDASTGVVLSGGQWQRSALARAFFRHGRDLMILDEPSSGLDPGAEAEVHARVRRHREGRTSLLISHRLNTVRDADQIVVLEDGVVAEQGSHDALLALDGVYARLFRLQARGFEVVGS
ncbi:ABC transporter ATP-binding protein [Nonomuraea sp. NPDC050328]|uniref:ABC transporter ATP-binding protein n=1 Tax=Nonomuraea sp. NPDC050328 TaxID=3364361 RepID=UPI00378C5389